MIKKTFKGTLAACLTAAVLAGCGHSDYHKTSTGMMYDIIEDGKGDKIKNGELLKVNYKAVLNDDSVLENTFDRIPAYGMADTTKLNMHNFTDILPLLRVGDSAVIVRFADTMRKMGQVPPTDSMLKPGSSIKVYVKVEKRFKNEDELRADYALEEEKELKREITGLKKYLADNKISYQQSSKGAFVQITRQGTGPQADSGKQVSVMYRGTNMEGRLFDSNLDPQFNHMGQPVDFVIGTGQVIPGWDDALRLFKQGGKGRLYIPAMLAYKNQPVSEVIKPYTNLVFDIEVVAVKDAPPAAMQPPMGPQ